MSSLTSPNINAPIARETSSLGFALELAFGDVTCQVVYIGARVCEKMLERRCIVAAVGFFAWPVEVLAPLGCTLCL